MKQTFFNTLLTVITCVFGLAVGTAANAQSYPNKPVRIVVSFAAGGPTDVIARVLAQDMTASLGQSVIVENKTGANSLIATEAVAKSPPDGYTLLFASLSHNVNAVLFKEKPRYDPLNDFEPISLAATLPLLIVTDANSPFNSVADIVKKAKDQPGEVSYGSAGNGGSAHLAAALLETVSGTKMTHVPFRGNAPALTEVLAGRVSFMFYPMIGVSDWVNQKKLKVLAIAAPKRSPDFASVPTMAEAGFPGFEDTAPWVGMLAPAQTPPAIVNRLNEAILKSLAKPESKQRLQSLGALTVGNSPAEFADFLAADKERWTRVIKAAGVKPE